MALPNDSLSKTKVYPNEYIDNITINRPLARLFENDEYLYEHTLIEVGVPSGSSASGELGEYALSGEMLYIYSPNGSGTNWGRVELDYSW